MHRLAGVARTEKPDGPASAIRSMRSTREDCAPSCLQCSLAFDLAGAFHAEACSRIDATINEQVQDRLRKKRILTARKMGGTALQS